MAWHTVLALRDLYRFYQTRARAQDPAASGETPLIEMLSSASTVPASVPADTPPPLVSLSLRERLATWFWYSPRLDALANNFIHPIIASFKLIFLGVIVFGSIFTQFGAKLLFDFSAASILSLSLLGLVAIESVAAIIRAFRGEKIYHTTPLNEFLETIVNCILFLLYFSSSIFYVSWAIGLILAIGSTFGSQANAERIHYQSLPFMQTTKLPAALQTGTCNIAFQRILQVIALLINTFVSTSRLFSFFVGQINGEESPQLATTRWILSGVWAALFGVTSLITAQLALTHRSFDKVKEDPKFVLSAILVFLNSFKSALWKLLVGVAGIISSFGLLTNGSLFIFGINFETFFAVGLLGLLALFAGRDAVKIHYQNVGEMEASPIPPSSEAVTAKTFGQAIVDAIAHPPLNMLTAPRPAIPEADAEVHALRQHAV